MSWTITELERWLRNAGKEKTVFFSHSGDKFLVKVEDGDGRVEGCSSTLVGAVDSAMSALQQRVYKSTVTLATVKPAVSTTYPTCSRCGCNPTIVYCDGRAECRCGLNWTMQLVRGTRVKLTNGYVYEYDGALWDLAHP